MRLGSTKEWLKLQLVLKSWKVKGQPSVDVESLLSTEYLKNEKIINKPLSLLSIIEIITCINCGASSRQANERPHSSHLFRFDMVNHFSIHVLWTLPIDPWQLQGSISSLSGLCWWHMRHNKRGDTEMLKADIIKNN